MSEENNIEQLNRILTDLHNPQTVRITDNEVGQDLIFVPNSVQVINPEEYLKGLRDAPRRLRHSSRMFDEKSFIDHVNRFKDENSAIFYNPENKTFNAVFDYHVGGEHKAPRWCGHTCDYALKESDALKKWKRNNNEALSQPDFAAFIEENVLDLYEIPDGTELPEELQEVMNRLGGGCASVSKMLELSRGIKINSDESAVSFVDRQTGQCHLEYKVEHKDGQERLKVPRMFMVKLQIFENGKLYPIPVWLRYRLNSGTVRWTYEMFRKDAAVLHAEEQLIKAISDSTELPVFKGSF